MYISKIRTLIEQTVQPNEIFGTDAPICFVYKTGISHHYSYYLVIYCIFGIRWNWYQIGSNKFNIICENN